MPGRTSLTEEEERAPDFQVAKDFFALLLCTNASGTLKYKPTLIYRAENLRVFKGKNKNHVPVYWKSNKTAWVTEINFKQ